MIDEYLESKVATATPYQLHLMVIDGAIRHARAARTALEQKKVPESRAALGQATSSSRRSSPGSTRSTWRRLSFGCGESFSLCSATWCRPTSNTMPQLVADSLSILESHRQTWLALAERLKQESPALAVSSAGGYSWSS